jgi:hypothetical protein
MLVARSAAARGMPRLALVLALLTPAGCGTWWRASFFEPERAPPPDLTAPFLKCHGAGGELHVLQRWSLDAERREIAGEGILYDAGRQKVREGGFRIPFDAVSLAETNRPETVLRADLVVLGVVAGVSLAVTAVCIANPKACFGSCPTFYTHGPSGERLQAEGFSASVARVFEATDVDALELDRPLGPTISIEMRNEALETHLVRSIRLLAVPRPPGYRVYQAEGPVFFPGTAPRPALSCRYAGGDCAGALRDADGQVLPSTSSDTDLAEREAVELAFPAPAGRSGLVLRARNSLLTTFVFYQGLAWLGTHAGEWMALLEREERGAAGPSFAGLEAILGSIDVQVRTARGWERAGRFAEVGPIAWETQVVPLPADLPPGEIRVRLEMTRGAWRLDQASLVSLGTPAAATPLPLAEVRRAGAADPEALRRLQGAGPRLQTGPGDALELRFAVPVPLREAEIFLESRGYYLEWMREPWLAEQDVTQAFRLAVDLRGQLRRLAPAYHRMEPEMDRIFWESRFGGGP